MWIGTFLTFVDCDIRVCKCVCLCAPTSLPPPPTPPFTSSKMLKCANLKHDTYSMKRKKGTVSVVLRFPPSQCHAHKSSACNAWTMSAALRLIRRMLTLRITLAAFVLFIPMSQCSTDQGTVCYQAFLSQIFCMQVFCCRCILQMLLNCQYVLTPIKINLISFAAYFLLDRRYSINCLCFICEPFKVKCNYVLWGQGKCKLVITKHCFESASLG